MSIKKKSCLDELYIPTPILFNPFSPKRSEKEKTFPAKNLGNSPQEQLEAQWSTFLTSWGISFRHTPSNNPEIKDPLESLPTFHINKTLTWLEIRPLSQAESCQETLELFAPFVFQNNINLLILFGAPRLRMPKEQGWGLKIQDEKMVASPVHLTECQGCGGFAASSIGTPQQRTEKLQKFTQIQNLATTPKLLQAYKEAQLVNMWMH